MICWQYSPNLLTDRVQACLTQRAARATLIAMLTASRAPQGVMVTVRVQALAPGSPAVWSWVGWTGITGLSLGLPLETRMSWLPRSLVSDRLSSRVGLRATEKLLDPMMEVGGKTGSDRRENLSVSPCMVGGRRGPPYWELCWEGGK